MWHRKSGVAFVILNETSILIYFNADDFSLFLKINHHASIWKPITYKGTKIIWPIQVIMYNKVYLFFTVEILIQEKEFS